VLFVPQPRLCSSVPLLLRRQRLRNLRLTRRRLSLPLRDRLHRLKRRQLLRGLRRQRCGPLGLSLRLLLRRIRPPPFSSALQPQRLQPLLRSPANQLSVLGLFRRVRELFHLVRQADRQAKGRRFARDSHCKAVRPLRARHKGCVRQQVPGNRAPAGRRVPVPRLQADFRSVPALRVRGKDRWDRVQEGHVPADRVQAVRADRAA
jgi:hypothetical protein